ncbi:MAG TPA: PIN domain-containing protein [Acidobacteriaceae bacterium]|nr:PIN domain-containing protein [Acidobacteriaceae bacterium]
MSGSVFFDTTILIYSVSIDDRRSTVAEDLLAGGGRISVQVLNEFAAVARRKLKMSWEEIDEALGAIRILCEPAAPLTVELHEASLKIAAKHGYHIYDSLILASAIDAGCNTIYSEDMQDGQRIGPTTIRNPFTTTSR